MTATRRGHRTQRSKHSGVKGPNGLTPQQELFVLKFLKDRNATQASIRAGYREHSARQQGARLLSKAAVRAAISAAMEKRLKRVKVETDRLEQENERIALSDVRKLFKEGRLIPIEELDDDTAAAVASVEVVTKNIGEGEVEHVAKVRLWDKPGALRTNLQLRGKLNDRNLNVKADLTVEQKTLETQLRRLDDEQLEALRTQLRALVSQLRGGTVTPTAQAQLPAAAGEDDAHE